jgi:AraC family transcriptional regulator of adaptative response / DNA-3-methyladenine glycosylase II
MIAVARALESGALQLDGSADVDAVVEALCAIRGIGVWTARYVAMRALAWPDAWLSGDVALSNALGLPKTASGFKQADALAEQWRPWRSYAVLHLWRQLASTRDLS